MFLSTSQSRLLQQSRYVSPVSHHRTGKVPNFIYQKFAIRVHISSSRCSGRKHVWHIYGGGSILIGGTRILPPPVSILEIALRLRNLVYRPAEVGTKFSFNLGNKYGTTGTIFGFSTRVP